MSERVRLGGEVVQLLLPQRRPFLMVDTVEDYRRAPLPTLRAARHISINEPIFDGHFPGLALWPGALIIEGLAQSCQLLGTLTVLDAVDGALAALQSWQRALRSALQPPSSPPPLAAPPRPHLLASVDVRLLAPVWAGQRLDYQVSESPRQPSDTLVRYELEALVDGQPVARGALVASR
jgi:3-hydroxyacyl-[acyl-carrier-protein] dehydratase